MAKTLVALIVGLCLALPAAAAQVKAETKKPVRPAWSELTPAQQKVLAPLAPEWESIDAPQRKKWVEIADRYPKMKPQEQQRLQKRMVDWAKLTPAERSAAREQVPGTEEAAAGQAKRGCGSVAELSALARAATRLFAVRPAGAARPADG